jgi:hypothetical protein
VSPAPSESWSGRTAFILASIGSAVGLGNIWKFPYTVGSSGGSAFVLIYVIAIFLIATPIMIAEMIIGRHARLSAPSAMKTLAEQRGSSSHWGMVGWMGLFALFLVLSFYSVIAGWTAAYLVKSASGAMSGLSPQEVGNGFNEFLHDPTIMIFWHALFTGTTIYIVSRGIKVGLERVVKVLMPALFITLIALVINSAITGDFAAATDFLFTADLSKITWYIVLAAVGQAFFSVNVGVGGVLTYSAYLPKDVNRNRRHAGRDAGGPGHFSYRICEWSGSGGRARSYFRHALNRVRTNAGRRHHRFRFLPHDFVRRINVIYFDARNHDSPSLRSAGHDTNKGCVVNRWQHIPGGADHRILVLNLGVDLSSRSV